MSDLRVYSPRISLHISSSRPMVGIYSINHSQTHECGNWDWDPDIPFLGIFVSKFGILSLQCPTKGMTKESPPPFTVYLVYEYLSRSLLLQVVGASGENYDWIRDLAEWIRSIRVRMRSSPVVRTSDSQCRSRNCAGFDPNIIRHSGIWGAADEAVLSIELKKIKKIKIIILRR
jgi:hypothetical protein